MSPSTAPSPGSPAMTEDEVFVVVRDAVVRVLEVAPERVTRGTSFVEDLRADSLALVEVVDLVEETLAPHARSGFRIEDDDLDELRTVGEAVAYAAARL